MFNNQATVNPVKEKKVNLLAVDLLWKHQFWEFPNIACILLNNHLKLVKLILYNPWIFFSSLDIIKPLCPDSSDPSALIAQCNVVM